MKCYLTVKSLVTIKVFYFLRSFFLLRLILPIIWCRPPYTSVLQSQDVHLHTPSSTLRPFTPTIIISLSIPSILLKFSLLLLLITFYIHFHNSYHCHYILVIFLSNCCLFFLIFLNLYILPLLCSSHIKFILVTLRIHLSILIFITLILCSAFFCPTL